MWRPEGWTNNYIEFKKEMEANPKKYLPWTSLKFDAIAIFEQGANAMLEALRKQGYDTSEGDGEKLLFGKEVFIPDDPPEKP